MTKLRAILGILVSLSLALIGFHVLPEEGRQVLALQAEEAEALEEEGFRLAASYYNTRDYSATLVLNHKGPEALEVFPTLYTLSGARGDVPPLIVEGNSFRAVSLAEWTGSLPETFSEGNLQLVISARLWSWERRSG